MNKIDREILKIDKVICDNIEKSEYLGRKLLSQNILSQLRNFVEHISLKVYSDGKDIEATFENIQKANKYVKSKGNLRFLSKFHKLLQISVSHYTPDEENSERLMLKYYEYLIKIKLFLKKKYNLEVLHNIEKFPINNDSDLKEYYKRILERLNQSTDTGSVIQDRYYIQKVKPIFFDENIFYEVTLSLANDNTSKFDRIIAFTKLELTHNYAVKLNIKKDVINILGKEMPILIIIDWEVSIRPCELENFSKIFGISLKIQSGYKEYRELMQFLTKTGLNLVEIIDLSEKEYLEFKDKIAQKVKVPQFLMVLDKCRTLTNMNRPGSNVIRYLLYRLNNKVIKHQYSKEECDKLSNLYLKFGCIPFDEMPFATSLKNHNPKLFDLLDCIDITDRKHEFLARLIKNKTEVEGCLYTSIKDIMEFENVEENMERYNNNLYRKHQHRRLEEYKGYIYIKGYEENTLWIIQKLKNLATSGIENYSNAVQYWLKTSGYQIDCDEKRNSLIQLFEKSKVALIYGSAGTGKSTMINHISNFFDHNRKLYLANTNPAIDNLKRKIKAKNCTFKTITKFLAQKNVETEFDLLIIDECSTVSNIDMVEVLKKASFKLLILVGDIFQIDSIQFGNWFESARAFVPKESVFELTKPFRSSNKKLLALWDKVRNMEDDILEHITKNDYSTNLNESIFDHSEDDEIILCLNYDGLYGINNINRFLQSNNENKAVYLGTNTYKINDPILFNESERFAPLIYNNLKGKIVGVKEFNHKIQFDIEIDKVISQLDAEGYDFQLIGNSDNGNSIIRFYVNKYRSTDFDDESSDSIVPFQVAYAVSIHKAQGLEYKSVKIVITDEVEEMITHNIFYTAITRAKEKLKIYWTPETENKVLKRMERKNIKRDIHLISSKLKKLSML